MFYEIHALQPGQGPIEFCAVCAVLYGSCSSCGSVRFMRFLRFMQWEYVLFMNFYSLLIVQREAADCDGAD